MLGLPAPRDLWLGASVLVLGCQAALGLNDYEFSAAGAGGGPADGAAGDASGGSSDAGAGDRSGASPASGGPAPAGSELATAPCSPGTRRCNDATPQTCGLEAGWSDEVACQGATPACHPATARCVACVSGSTRRCVELLGNCARGEQACREDSTWGPCSVGPVSADRCDVAGDDASCDGQANGGCPCVNGDMRSCGPEARGICQPGTQACTNAAWGDCAGAVSAGPRRCDSALDNDCDGTPDNTVDDACLCAVGASMPCPPQALGCRVGSMACLLEPDGSTSHWGECVYGDADPLTACDDGNPMTFNDVCNQGTCQGIECDVNADCNDLAASRCEANRCTACLSDTDCAHVSVLNVALPVCEAGLCVQCTGLKRAACGSSVCDAVNQFCTDLAPQSADLCSPCVSDAQCQPNQLCSTQIFEGVPVGSFCLPLPNDGQCTSPPFAGLVSTVSTDGVAASLCELRRTTCPALTDYFARPCTFDTDCGAVDLRDGICDLATGICTTPCTSDLDCPGSNCVVQACFF